MQGTEACNYHSIEEPGKQTTPMQAQQMAITITEQCMCTVRSCIQPMQAQ
uniref:Uncharacterized protein n=1 Tax=Arundo donax TaxID=35708 RepID=A0A0A9B990_ARUDO